MTTNLETIKIDGVYHQRDKPLENFYGPCLKQSIKYDRAVGYFRSTAYALITSDILPFIQNGGKIRLICSTQIRDQDIEAIYEAYKNPHQSISNNISQLISELNDQYDYPKVLASLIKFGHLEIKFIFKEKGIFHEKWGIFYDDNNNNVYFSGSYNETYAAWDHEHNLEHLLTRCSWKGVEDKGDILREINEFELYWENSQQGSITKSMNDDVKKELLSIAYNEESELESELLKIKEKNDKNSLDVSQNKLEKKEISLWDTAYDHQIQAIEEWKKNNKRGLIAHATGSGKTYTGILALDDHFKDHDNALITVPSEILVQQWAEEISSHLPDVEILKCSSTNKNWKDIFNKITKIKIENKKIIYLGINDSFQDIDILERLSSLEGLFFLADEVHRLGAPGNYSTLKILKDIDIKMGLSATPMRMGDKEGNDRIKSCFGSILKNCIFTVSDAISEGYLSTYNYYPMLIHLDEAEEGRWNHYTRKIINLMNTEENKDEQSEDLKLLTINRARIAKKASQKIDLSFRVIVDNFKLNQDQRWLVFLEDIEQIEDLKGPLIEENLPLYIYHSNLKDDVKERTLDSFKEKEGIILSIKCLDEGINIPSASKALIVASSQNYREFIQRRGRVLRKSKDKIADIYDILVNPKPLEGNNYIKKELKRSYIFAQDALNKTEAESKLNLFSIDAHLDPDTLIFDKNTFFNEEIEGDT